MSELYGKVRVHAALSAKPLRAAQTPAHLYVTGALFQFDSWLNFTDAAGQSWQRNGDGSLRELASIAAMPAVVSLHSTYKPIATCS